MVRIEKFVYSLMAIAYCLMDAECLLYIQNIFATCDPEEIFRISHLLVSNSALRLAYSMFVERSAQLAQDLLVRAEPPTSSPAGSSPAYEDGVEIPACEPWPEHEELYHNEIEDKDELRMRWREYKKKDLYYANVPSTSSGIFSAATDVIDDNVNLMALADVAAAERLRNIHAARESVDGDSSDEEEEVQPENRPEPWRPWQERIAQQVGAGQQQQQQHHQQEHQQQQHHQEDDVQQQQQKQDVSNFIWQWSDELKDFYPMQLQQQQQKILP